MKYLKGAKKVTPAEYDTARMKADWKPRCQSTEAHWAVREPLALPERLQLQQPKRCAVIPPSSHITHTNPSDNDKNDYVYAPWLSIDN